MARETFFSLSHRLTATLVVLTAEPAEQDVSWGSEDLKLGLWQLPDLSCSFSFFV